MGHTSKTRKRGFTLLEMTIALAVGLLVLGGTVQLSSQGVDATWVVSQKAEMQQDLRAASDLLMKDISLAGAGLPNESGLGLPTGTGTKSIYGCDQSGNCPPNGAIAYPCAPGSSPCAPTLYPIIPGYQLGITPPGSTTKSDVITVVYSDVVLALNCYTITFPLPLGSTINPVTFTAPLVSPPPSSCILPPGVTFPQALTDPVVGLKPGDVLLFTNGSLQAAAEVSTVAGPLGAAVPGSVYTVTFANADPLELNQSTATGGDLKQLVLAGDDAERIDVITYYLKNQADPIGAGTGTPVLMRQVNGQTAVPVAENVVNFQFTYDTYNTDGTLLANVGDGGYSAGVSYNLIRKINVIHMSIRSTMSGARTALMATKGYQTFDFQTSISARNSAYQNRYNN
jgi:prepilin-type N-terminal cleavage/methylation domain-containing protein